MTIAWNDSLIIDNGVIDEDHKVLIKLIGEVLDAVHNSEEKDVIVHKLNVIRMFALQHFSREEKLQESAGFPDCEKHKSVHSILMDELIFNIKKIISGYSSMDGADEVRVRYQAIEKFMNKWLIMHIMVEDTNMKPYVEAMRKKAATMSPLKSYLKRLVG